MALCYQKRHFLLKTSPQGQKPDIHAAKKVASTDTLGSDAALDVESNDSLYGKFYFLSLLLAYRFTQESGNSENISKMNQK